MFETLLSKIHIAPKRPKVNLGVPEEVEFFKPFSELRIGEVRSILEMLAANQDRPGMDRIGKRLKNSGLLDRYMRFATSTNRRLKVDALITFGHLQYEPAFYLLKEATSAKDPELVSAAVDGLIAWNQVKAYEVLVDMLSEQCPIDLSRVINALKQTTFDLTPAIKQKLIRGDIVGISWASKLI